MITIRLSESTIITIEINHETRILHKVYLQCKLGKLNFGVNPIESASYT